MADRSHSQLADRADSQPSLADHIGQLASHAFYSSIEAPLSAGYQLLNKLSGDRLPEWHIDRPAGDSGWAKAGDLIGSAGLFLGASKLSSIGMGKLGLAPTAENTLLRNSSIAALDSAIAGAGVGLLQPVDGNANDFWGAKLKTTAETSFTLGAMGGAAKTFEAAGWFGQAGTRTIAQSISLNAAAGGVGGIAGSFAHAGLFEGSLPSAGQVIDNAAQYAAFGAAFGTVDWAAPKVVAGTQTAFSRFKPASISETSFVPESLAMKLPNETVAADGLVREARTATIDAALEAPLPDFSNFDVQTYPEAAPLYGPARTQTTEYIRSGVVDQPFASGVRLPTSTKTAGLLENGTPRVRSERYVVIDPWHDPALQATIEDAQTRFAGITNKHELATAISKYVARVLNREHISGPELEARYEEQLKAKNGTLMPLGEFIRQGNGACLQQAALFKVIAESMGMRARLFEGTVDMGQIVDHAWADAEMDNGQHLIYDPAQQNNGALMYDRPKDRSSYSPE